MKFDLSDLNKIRSFAAVFENGSVQAAAKALRLTPSAISVSVKNLEKELGAPLFARMGKRFVPTMEAKQLYEVSTNFSQELAKVVGQIKLSQENVAGTLRIGVPIGFGSKVLIPAAADFRKSYPDVGFVFRFGGPNQIWNLLDSGDVDIMISGALAKPPCDSVYTQKILSQCDLHLICSAVFFREDLQGDATLETLATSPHIAITETRGHLENWYINQFTIVPALATPVEVDSVFGAIEAIRHHWGLALIPEKLVERELASGEFVKVPSPRGGLGFRYLVYRRAERILSKTEKTFLTFIENRFERQFEDSNDTIDFVYDRH